MDFELWLEFEETVDTWDTKNEFCNIQVTLSNGTKYGINVWTFDFFDTALKETKEAGENLNCSYLKPPDLFVQELTRDCIQRTIEDLLKVGPLDDMLNPSIVSSE